MKRLLNQLFLLIIVASWVSCTRDENISQPDFSQAKNIRWRLIAFETVGKGIIGLQSVDSIFLRFEENGVTSGSSSGLCGNYYQGVYILGGGNSIQVGSVGTTEAACPDSRYWEYIDKFKRVNSFQLDGSRLYLQHNGATQRLVFERMSS